MWDRFILLHDLLRAGYSGLESEYANTIAVGGQEESKLSLSNERNTVSPKPSNFALSYN